MELIEVKEVDESLLQEIVRRIVPAMDPVRIILFGSHAYGTPGKGSDPL
jgi:predicted nucleotidyltransferase